MLTTLMSEYLPQSEREPMMCIALALNACRLHSADLLEQWPLYLSHVRNDNGVSTVAYSAVVALGMLVFFSRNFSLAATPAMWASWTLQSKNLSNFILWTLVCVHLTTGSCPVWCSFACSLIQVPPFRSLFSTCAGRWPWGLAIIMPTMRVDQSLRQLLGPPYVMYTVKMAMEYFAFAPCLSFLTAMTAISASCFVRPDNDWAGTHTHIRTVIGNVKRVHGMLMCTSFFCNLAICGWLVMS